MVIGHRHKYLFVEVPATASTAISKELREQYGGELVLYKHANYSEFRTAAKASERDYFVFAGVRNPLEVTVGHYLRLKNDRAGVYSDPTQYESNGGWIPQTHVEKFDFIRDNAADFPTFFRRFYRGVFNEWVLLGSRDFDFVIRYENLQADFATALNRIGIPQVRELPVVNRGTERRHYSEYYPPDLQPLAARVFGPFMEKWGYELPSSWLVKHAPLGSRLRFTALDLPANLLARFVALSPHSQALQKLHGLLRGA
ncbi:MAG: hypothetical protein ACKVZ0_07930 [Gemmatimonadales bacterium]